MRAIPSLFAVAAVALTGCARPNIQTDLGPLVTDRPDFTESAVTIPSGHTQVEMGGTFNREDGVRSLSTGETLVRSGLSRRVELRVTSASYAVERSNAGTFEGLEDAGLGLKIALHEGPEGPSAEPTLALIVGTSLPTGAQPFRSRRALPEAKFLGAWTFSDRVGFASNLNWARTESASNEWSASASFAFSLSEKVGAYTEGFSFAEHAGSWQTRNYVNAGFTYLFSDALQVDARAGSRVGDDSHGVFFGLGISRRF